MHIKKLIESVHFEKVSHQHQTIIFEWLAESHMQEFWDNSQEHKDDIINFINGRREPSNYFGGVFTYWVGIIGTEPFSFILTSEIKSDEALNELWRQHLSTTGTTIGIDFSIGNPVYLNKGLAVPTLDAFTKFFKTKIDPAADTFFIDPNDNNPRAIHVYTKAGFIFT